MRLPGLSAGRPDAASDLFMGCDPGTQGAVAVVDGAGLPVERIRLSKATPRDLSDWLARWSGRITSTMLESVGSRPGQGVSSTFKFGRAAGMLEGMLVVHRIPYELVTPAKWQAALRCLSKGDKNVTKAAAQRLFPTRTIVHEDADGWLLAEFCRRKTQGRS